LERLDVIVVPKHDVYPWILHATEIDVRKTADAVNALLLRVVAGRESIARVKHDRGVFVRREGWLGQQD
jgi:hypothetical protein